MNSERNKKDIEAFFAETKEAFQFLESEYGHQLVSQSVTDLEDPRETFAQSRYAKAQIGVGVQWDVGASIIKVSFVELLQPPDIYPVFAWYVSKAIDLYDLAHVRAVFDDPDFLLKDIDNWRKRDKRADFIDNKRRNIIFGLSRATKKYANNILNGDISVFDEVIKYHKKNVEH